jgi:hypothetical protein
MNNHKTDIWAKRVKGEFCSLGSAYVWTEHLINIRNYCRTLKGRYNITERQRMFARFTDIFSIYYSVSDNFSREEYIRCSNNKKAK